MGFFRRKVSAGVFETVPMVPEISYMFYKENILRSEKVKVANKAKRGRERERCG